MRWIFILLIACSCGPAWHLKKAKEHQLKAEAKGATIDRDTIFKTIKIPVLVKGDSGQSVFTPVINEIDFFEAISDNDSLAILLGRLRESGLRNESITSDMDNLIATISRVTVEKRKLEKRIAQGFSKDSTYVLEDDHIRIDTEVKDGLLKNQHYRIKDKSITVEDHVPVQIKNIFKAGYTIYQIIGFGIGLAIIFIVIGYTLGINTKK